MKKSESRSTAASLVKLNDEIFRSELATSRVRSLPGSQGLDARLVDVETDDRIAASRKGDGNRQPNVSETNDCDLSAARHVRSVTIARHCGRGAHASRHLARGFRMRCGGAGDPFKAALRPAPHLAAIPPEAETMAAAIGDQGFHTHARGAQRLQIDEAVLRPGDGVVAGMDHSMQSTTSTWSRRC